LVRHVIVQEFGGTEASELAVEALTEFLSRFLPAAAEHLDRHGRLATTAPEAARRGETLFYRPSPRNPALSCATCHPPGQFFTDRRRHDVGSGGLIDAPGLQRGSLLAPLFHDGRFDGLEQVIAHFGDLMAIALTPLEIGDLVAYLDIVAGRDVIEPITVTSDLGDVGEVVALLGQLITRRADSVLAAVIGDGRRRLGAVHRRFDLPDTGHGLPAIRAEIVELSRMLRAVERAAESGDWLGAAEKVATMSARLSRSTPVIVAAAPFSLYDRDRLRRFEGR